MNNFNSLVQVSAKGNDIVDARELHNALESKRDFSNWFKYKKKQARLVENVDYALLNKFGEQKGSGGSNKKDYALTMDAAKSIAMLEGTERGDAIRRFFIERDKQLTLVSSKTPIKALSDSEMMAKAFLIATNTIARIEAENKSQILQLEVAQPKVEFHDSIVGSTGNIDVSEFAKMHKEVLRFGRNKMFKTLREHKILMASNLPYQKYMDKKYFEVTEVVKNEKNFTKTLITPAGQSWLFNLLK